MEDSLLGLLRSQGRVKRWSIRACSGLPTKDCMHKMRSPPQMETSIYGRCYSCSCWNANSVIFSICYGLFSWAHKSHKTSLETPVAPYWCRCKCVQRMAGGHVKRVLWKTQCVYSRNESVSWRWRRRERGKRKVCFADCFNPFLTCSRQPLLLNLKASPDPAPVVKDLLLYNARGYESVCAMSPKLLVYIMACCSICVRKDSAALSPFSQMLATCCSFVLKIEG